MTLQQRTRLRAKRDKPRRDKHPMPMPGGMKNGRVKDNDRENSKHLVWVRSEPCCLRWTGECSGQVQAAHVRCGTDGGTGIKPSDKWVLPLCAKHHRLQHQIGEPEFEIRYCISMKAIAAAMYAKSPYRKAEQ